MTARRSSCTRPRCPPDAAVKAGTRLEFGIADGKRGAQALSVRVLDAPPSLVKLNRKPADDMAIIVEDLVKLLDGIGANLERGRYPESRTATAREDRAPMLRRRSPTSWMPELRPSSDRHRAPTSERLRRWSDDAARRDVARARCSRSRPPTPIGERRRPRRRGATTWSPLLFERRMPGYPGWHWTVSCRRIGDEAEPTVLETELMPGENALLAPDWVPWSERLADYQAAQACAAERRRRVG